MIRLAFLAAVVSIMPLSANAEDRLTLGWGRLLDNDALGDLHDRWHSGSYTVSMVRGPLWTGELPRSVGDVLEYRFSGSTITSANLENPAADDRRYAGVMSFGLHTHFDMAGLETSLGVDLVALGPQTGIGKFQSWLHELLGVDKPDLSNQLGDGLFPTIRAEVGRSFWLSDNVTVRPYASAQTGVETLVRAGGDVMIGSFGRGGLMLRDDATGQRYRGIEGDRIPGMSFTMGGDVARVYNSALLPSDGAAELSDTRGRLRAGVAWQGLRTSAFYGMTYLSPDFEDQSNGQVVGSVNINLQF
jgi:hypothetical protein